MLSETSKIRRGGKSLPDCVIQAGASGGKTKKSVQSAECRVQRKTITKWSIFLLTHLLTYSLSHCLYGAFETKPPAGRTLGMGGAFVGFSNDINAIDYNPAGLRLIPAFQFSSTYSNIYSVAGLNYSQVKFAFPVRGCGSTGILYSDFGPSEYKEQVFIFSHGFGISKGIMFGYNIKSMCIKISEYGDDSALGLDIGALAQISEDFMFGVSAKNINEPEISRGHEKLTEEFLTGFFYRPLAGLNLAFDIEKVLDKPVALHMGAEFRLTGFFMFRTGLQTNPSQYTLGMGVNYEKIYMDYAYVSHATLDGMHIFSLSVKYGGKKERKKK
ncbi:MAG: conjugal transfer protein TraF [Elusimicrobia bacterium]|nr:conjugal transfer protein TraF [Elusimicrobiota bacterium]